MTEGMQRMLRGTGVAGAIGIGPAAAQLVLKAGDGKQVRAILTASRDALVEAKYG